jgi:hypothetical protein
MLTKLNSMKFRKKPLVIDAMQWTGENLLEVIRFTGLNPSASHFKWDEYAELVRNDGLKIFTLEGKMSAGVGDWIIKGVKGEFYPCKEDIFNMTYELAKPVQVIAAYQSESKPSDMLSVEDYENIDPIWHWMYRPLYAALGTAGDKS